jgi:hypothetical protein
MHFHPPQLGEGKALSGDELAKSKHLWLMRRKRLRFSIGNCFLQLQDILQATRTFEGILREEPHNLRLRSGLGRLALHLGDLRTASRRFAQVAEQVGDAAENETRRQRRPQDGKLLGAATVPRLARPSGGGTEARH